ncbi:glycine zipper family protein [Roseicella sp. DB1501]|uniref:glycine zipper family protein n=1 Tax=Roseicella sp. DB1501 TaxID=2730925 RepID=UPI0015838F8C|nr:glycine zipper family protein [Roseicella sp. DB1501]
MTAAKHLLVLCAVLSLAACASGPPTGPGILSLPPDGKDLAQFRSEDAACRAYAAGQIGYGLPAAGTAPAVVDPKLGLQQRYDIAYAQCMSASGNRLQAFPVSRYYSPYYGPYAYPVGYYGPWFGSSISVGYVGRIGGRTHFHRGIGHGGGRRR